jgi:urease subunit alpha
VPDGVRLGDTALEVVPERDDVGGPDALVPGFGNTMRDGLGVRAQRGGVDVAVIGGLVLDPVLGVRRSSLGIRDGRIVGIGRAGNPDTMDGVDVVLDAATAVFDASGMIVTPGGIDSHVHWLSPQVADALLASGVTTMVSQDYGPVWNLGTNPAEGLQIAWAALEAFPINAALLVRGSAVDGRVSAGSLAAGGAGLKIHEDVGAGPRQIRTALDVCDREDVQLAIHTDGLNEVLCVEDTLAAFGGRTVHAYHVEGAGGGHAPDLLRVVGRERVLTSSTSPTVPYGRHTVREHLAMVAAVHVLEPGRVHGDLTAATLRVRAGTMAAEGVLHDMGLIHMLSSDSQGMGRAGEVIRRAFQNADAMRRARGGEPGPGDNARVLRHLAKVTINPARAHGLGHDVGSLEIGKVADLAMWTPEQFAVRPELVLKLGMPAWGASGDPNATTMGCEPVLVRPQIAAHGAAAARVSLAFLAGSAMDAELPTTRPRSRVHGCREVTAADMCRNERLADVTVDPRTHEVRVDGEPVAAEPLTDVALSGRYLLG